MYVIDRQLISLLPWQFLVHCASWLFPSFQFEWLVRDMKLNLPKELNFVHEAHNMEKFSKLFSCFSFIKVWSSHLLLFSLYWDGKKQYGKMRLEFTSVILSRGVTIIG